MRETLYIRLRSTAVDAPTAFCIAGSDAMLSWPVQEAPLEHVLDQARNRRVVVLVPGADVRLTQVKVPARTAAKVLQATPYALEDQLAEDVDTLHFALGPRQVDGAWPVAIAAHERMNEWLAPLRERGIAVEALIPETLCLPPAEHLRWTALAEDTQITVRSGAYGGFSCMPEDLPFYLHAGGISAETILRIVMPRSFQGDFTRLEHPVELLPGFDSPLQALLQNLSLDRSINLLQGDYSQREDLKRLWLPWRTAALLLAAWIVVAGLHHGIEALRLGGELAAQQEQNATRFRQLFPTEQRIVDLSAQLEQQARLLKGGAQQGGFLTLMETLGAAMGSASGLSVQSLQFREGALYVSLTGSDLQQLESLRGWFEQNRAVQMEVQSANSGADGVQIRLKLSPA